MKLHEYWLGLHPLDWEFCFMPVQTYKNFITEQYHKNPAFYNISAGSIEKVLAHIDAILSAAMEDWNKTTNHAALRCPPMIFPLPKGQESNVADFAVILKMDNDGDTVAAFMASLMASASAWASSIRACSCRSSRHFISNSCVLISFSSFAK